MKQILIFLLSINAVFAQQDSAYLQLDTTILDYGIVLKGSDPWRSIGITNTGKSTLIIYGIFPSTGALNYDFPKACNSIFPGEKCILKVCYYTQVVGSFNKTITIKSNASNSPVYLKVKGEVILPKPIEIQEEISK